jgi:hypothetical protein
MRLFEAELVPLLWSQSGGEGEKPMLTGGGLTVLARSEGPQRNNNFEVVLVTASTSYYYY